LPKIIQIGSCNIKVIVSQTGKLFEIHWSGQKRDKRVLSETRKSIF